LLGRSDSPLTDRGREQAVALSPLLAGAGRVVTSPLARARDTAEALSLGLPVEVDERWVEVDYGDYEGQSLSSVPRRTWAKWRSNPEEPWPGGESLCDVSRRVAECCEELFALEGDGARADSDLVVVSHVSPIKAAVAWALGAEATVVWRLYLANGSITRIGWGADAPVLRSFNETFPAAAAASAAAAPTAASAAAAAAPTAAADLRD
jgi:alpha-ribazole phosphatase